LQGPKGEDGTVYPLHINGNGVLIDTFDGKSEKTINISPDNIGAVKKPAGTTTANNIVAFDANGGLIDTGKKISEVLTTAVSTPMPNSTTSFVNFVNQAVGNRASIGVTSGSPIYYIMREIKTGTLSEGQECGCEGRLLYTGTNPITIAMSDILFVRGYDQMISRCNLLYGGGKNGTEIVAGAEGIFCKSKSDSKEYMAFRITTNNTNGVLTFLGNSINQFVETNVLSVLNSTEFNNQYTVTVDCNPRGQADSWNVGAAQLTGETWTKNDGTRKRIFRATFRGRVVPGEQTWVVLSNVDSFLGWGEACKIMDSSGTDYPINYSDPGYLNINTKFSGGKVTTKLSVLDGNVSPWNISTDSKNALVTFYYLRTDA
jgi:hypothetical protein